ncbi:MutY DNA glycosylase [gamma proteobacterium HdN1]|nr:MutY DNA glycosylase [gamma proteobacterium HdN1]
MNRPRVTKAAQNLPDYRTIFYTPPHTTDKPSLQRFDQLLLEWYDHHGRKELPWQVERSPYRTWVSEIMCQQTRVGTVIPYFERFMAHFPSLSALAQAPIDEVLGLWTGLGYYARARNLHKTAQIVQDCQHGEFPKTIDSLMQLPGIGRSTAGAILASSLSIRAPILDGNVKRVLARVHRVAGWPSSPATEKVLWALAEQYTPYQRIPDYTQAIMDLGAMVCTPSKPDCAACPLTTLCEAFQHSEQAQYPQPKPNKALPERAVRLIIAMHEGTVWLARRPPLGVWGGLWSFPELSMDVPLTNGLLEMGIHCRENPVELPSFRHTFSHFHLQITPTIVEVESAVGTMANVVAEAASAWYKPADAMKLGLPAPVLKLLQELDAGR